MHATSVLKEIGVRLPSIHFNRDQMPRVLSGVAPTPVFRQILACADARRVDLIALGSRGHGRLTGLLLGSVAQKVVTSAQCAILVVH